MLEYALANVKERKGLQKHVMRYPQMFATKAIESKLNYGVKKGIIWHTQGAGNYFRYCDDMLFIAKPTLRDDAETVALKEIEQLELTINTKKTEKRDFYHYDGQLRCKGRKVFTVFRLYI